MNKQQAIDLVRATFESPFNRERYANFIGRLLNQMERDPFTYTGQFIPDAFRATVSKYERLGKYNDDEGKRVDILIVYLQRESSVERARATQRRFIAGYLQGKYGSSADKDAALVAFVSAENAAPTAKADDWRFSLVKLQTRLEATAKGGVKVVDEFTPARRWSFLVGANERSHTAQTRLVPIMQETERNPTLAQLEEAFNIEKVTKEFFEKYRDLFIRTKAELDKAVAANPKAQADLRAKGVDTVNLAKKLLGQIVFLYYLQKKGWFGVPRDSEWGDGSKQFLRELFAGKHGRYANFFNDILEPLFYEALRIDRSHDDHYYSRFNCRIPFLNGGLFDPMGDYDWVRADILLPNDLFSNQNKTKEGDTGDGILDIFDRYNFTVREDEPFEKEVAIDPELLGKAYEKFNAIRPDNYDEFVTALRSGKKGEESKFNKQYGVYYTPREIVHYMCQQSLIHYLATQVGERVSQTEIADLIQQGEAWREHDARVVKEGRETDTYPFIAPAAIRAHAALLDEKLAAITVCDPAAGSGAFPVGMMSEIVRARQTLTTYLPDLSGFSKPDRSPYAFKRDCIEHALYGVDIDPGAVEIAKLRLWLSLIVDEEDIRQIKPLPNLDYKIVCGNSLIGFPEQYQTGSGQEIERLIRDHFHETHPTRKEQFKQQIDAKINARYASSRKALGYQVNFDFRTVFAEVFQRKGGFDVVIGNPPYNAEFTVRERRFFKERFEAVTSGRQDSCAIFIERAKQISNKQGVLSYILPYRLFSRKRNHGQFQKWFLGEYSIKYIIYLGSDIGFSANDEFMIVLANLLPPQNNEIQIAMKPAMSDLANNAVSFQTISQSVYIDRQEINLSLLRYSMRFLEKISHDTQPLEAVCHVRDGIIPHIRDKLISDKKLDTRYVKFAGIAGKYTLDRYYFSYEPLWLCYDIEEARKHIRDESELRKVQLREKSIFLARKIITSQNSATLKGSIDKNQVFVSNSIHSSFLKDECKDKVYLEYILGLINSKLLNYYHDSLRVKAVDLHPQILIGHLKVLPIKVVDKVQQQPIVKLVDRVLLAKQANPQADTRAWEAEIDRLVYALYGLTAAEIALVEGRADGR